MEPGIYRDIPASVYHTWPGASASRLSDLSRSPLHAWHAIRHPSEPTDAMRFGTLIHTALLQPHLMRETYATAGQCEATTKAGGRCSKMGSGRYGGQWHCGTHAPDVDADAIETVTGAMVDACAAIGCSVASHDRADNLLAGASERELSIFWTDEETGVLCKGRCDGVDSGRGILLDLKTTADASPDAFGRSFVNYGYHRQLAHYVDGLAAVGRPVDSVAVLAVEKEAPFAIAVYEVPPEVLDLGRRELRPLLDRWAECMALDGPWPGYVGIDGVLTLDLPAWAYKEKKPALV